MPPVVDPLAVDFANTRSSIGRDRIGTLEQFRGWAGGWPVLAAPAGELGEGDLAAVLSQRDTSQLVLHHLAAAELPPEEVWSPAMQPGLAAAPFRLVPVPGGGATLPGQPLATVRHLLGRALVDLVLNLRPGELHRCHGVGCERVFVARRVDRRWCDSRICGNRARVAAHARRHRERQ
ncbi:MAG TPA: CGNR zinc finger domain-containing protein [Pseudonocardia sp.]|uniref:CGNR zinc finger domain-containing protein n=1 Tax=Pseudonocardia sp. TaxID=60912 RepID=UPI002CC9D8BD|nr:CGNR zinc finger domain-containing protein [Pseudonocardia sp.]HTF45864.1 CGNR zinc finger domain-containing protein [Pseudonocardia sp.]